MFTNNTVRRALVMEIPSLRLAAIGLLVLIVTAAVRMLVTFKLEHVIKGNLIEMFWFVLPYVFIFA